MNISQLQTFLTVANTGSFTKAAEQLHLSQSAVSRQISSLEAEIGVELFQRIHSTLVLSAAGAIFRDRIDALLPKIWNAIDEVRQLRDGERGRLHIGLLEDQRLTDNICNLIRWLGQEKISLSIRRMSFMALENGLLDGDIDLAISIAQENTVTYPGCKRKIYDEESMCLAIHRSLWTEAVEPSEEDWFEEVLDRLEIPCLMPSTDSFPVKQRAALTALMCLDWHVLQQYDFAAISPMVSAGLAATLCNESHILSTDPSVLLIPIKGRPTVEKGVFYLHESNNPIVRFLDSNL